MQRIIATIKPYMQLTSLVWKVQQHRTISTKYQPLGEDSDSKSPSILQHSLQARYARRGIPLIGALNKPLACALTHICIVTHY